MLTKLCNQVMLIGAKRVMRYVLENWNIKGAWRLPYLTDDIHQRLSVSLSCIYLVGFYMTLIVSVERCLIVWNVMLTKTAQLLSWQ